MEASYQKIKARQTQSDGGCLVEIEVSQTIADLIPERWTWTSKIKGLPETFKKKYTMLYKE